MIYILIIILGGLTTQSGYSTVVAGFNTLDACEAARKHIISSSIQAADTRNPAIRSHGCHAKGERK